MSLAVGDVVEGVVSNLTKFGAFVNLDSGLTGLVHISEISDTFVTVSYTHLTLPTTPYV